jgi:hypothetical protein
MDEEELISAVRERARNPMTRTDYADRGCPDLAAPATVEAVQEAERAIGCALHPLHRRLLLEVGNGGFGPGDGLIGLPGGRLDEGGRSLVELCSYLWVDAETPGLPPGVVPLCDWGDAIWSCLDEEADRMLTLDESGLTDTGQSFQTWLMDWVSGVSLFGKMFIFTEMVAKNPFTRQLVTVRVPARPFGTPYTSRPRRPGP